MQKRGFYNNAIFWVEVDRISPNPYQPRKEFDQKALEDLADSIKQYGVLQPLVVTRKEVQRQDGSMYVEYELIAGERRLRASKLAGLSQVPVLIRDKEDTDKVKLELAIIENLQREDLNPIDRAKAFKQLVDEFGMTHTEIAKKVGKSREYVSNTLRLLALPEHIQQSLVNKEISEGHARPLLMLTDRKQEQETLFREIILKKMNVREAEKIARSIATERARKKELPPKLSQIQKELTEELGTRVEIEQKQKGGKIKIDFFSEEDLMSLLEIIKKGHQQSGSAMDSIKQAISAVAISQTQTNTVNNANPQQTSLSKQETVSSVNQGAFSANSGANVKDMLASALSAVGLSHNSAESGQDLTNNDYQPTQQPIKAQPENEFTPNQPQQSQNSQLQQNVNTVNTDKLEPESISSQGDFSPAAYDTQQFEQEYSDPNHTNAQAAPQAQYPAANYKQPDSQQDTIPQLDEGDDALLDEGYDAVLDEGGDALLEQPNQAASQFNEAQSTANDAAQTNYQNSNYPPTHELSQNPESSAQPQTTILETQSAPTNKYQETFTDDSDDDDDIYSLKNFTV